LGGRGRQISEFEASLVYKVSSRTARAIQRNPVSKKQKTNKQTNKQTKTKKRKKKRKEKNKLLVDMTTKRNLTNIQICSAGGQTQESLLFFFFFWFLRHLCSPGCPGTYFVDQAGLKLRNPPASASQVPFKDR
jgi:hypothetical protein